MKIAFAKSELPSAGTIVVGVLEEHRLTPTAQQLDKLTKGAIGRALGVGRFKGRPDEQLAILAPPGIEAARILLIGLGKADALDAATLLAIGGRIAAALNAPASMPVAWPWTRSPAPRSAPARWPPIWPRAPACAPIASTNTARARSPSRSRR
jgi:Leucyl aminopeptidase